VKKRKFRVPAVGGEGSFLASICSLRVTRRQRRGLSFSKTRWETYEKDDDPEGTVLRNEDNVDFDEPSCTNTLSKTWVRMTRPRVKRRGPRGNELEE